MLLCQNVDDERWTPSCFLCRNLPPHWALPLSAPLPLCVRVVFQTEIHPVLAAFVSTQPSSYLWYCIHCIHIFIQSAPTLLAPNVSVTVHRTSFATFSLIAREKIWPHGNPRLDVFASWHKAGGWKNANDHVFSCRISALRAPGLKWGDNSVLEPIILAFSCKLL